METEAGVAETPWVSG